MEKHILCLTKIELFVKYGRILYIVQYTWKRTAVQDLRRLELRTREKKRWCLITVRHGTTIGKGVASDDDEAIINIIIILFVYLSLFSTNLSAALSFCSGGFCRWRENKHYLLSFFFSVRVNCGRIATKPNTSAVKDQSNVHTVLQQDVDK